MINSEKYMLTSTKCFVEIAKDSEGRNRGPTASLFEHLDPNGIHFCVFKMLHNDTEYRTLWLVKLKNRHSPLELFMDASFDSIERHTVHLTKDECSLLKTCKEEAIEVLDTMAYSDTPIAPVCLMQLRLLMGIEVEQ